MRRAVLGLLLVAAAACDPGGPTAPGGIDVALTLTNPVALAPPGALRLAVGWRTEERSGAPWVTTFDRPLTAETSQRVHVELPEGVDLDDLIDAVTLGAKCPELGDGRTWPGVTPLWVAYEDLDRDERLDPAGSDRVWAVADLERSHLAAFVDVEAAFSQASVEGAECLNRMTGGDLSPFVSGVGSSWVSADAVRADEFTLSLSPSRLPGARLACGRGLAWRVAPVRDPTVLGVAPDTVPDACADEAVACTAVEATEQWRELSHGVSVPGYQRYVQCVEAGDWEVLWVSERSDECAGCTCTTHLQDRGWVVSRDAPPDDWPCDRLPSCLTPAERVEVIPTDCEPE